MIQPHSISSSCGLLEEVGPVLLYYPNGEAKNFFYLAIDIVQKPQCMLIAQNTHNEHIFLLSKVVQQFADLKFYQVSPVVMAC